MNDDTDLRAADLAGKIQMRLFRDDTIKLVRIIDNQKLIEFMSWKEAEDYLSHCHHSG